MVLSLEEGVYSTFVPVHLLVWQGWGPGDNPESLGDALSCGVRERSFFNLHLIGEKELGEPQKARIGDQLLPLVLQRGPEVYDIPILFVDSHHTEVFLPKDLENLSNDRIFSIYPVFNSFAFNIGSDRYFLRRNGRWLSLFVQEGRMWKQVRKQ
jgi:hypothetical protein